jgi:hypothetical protein
MAGGEWGQIGKQGIFIWNDMSTGLLTDYGTQYHENDKWAGPVLYMVGAWAPHGTDTGIFKDKPYNEWWGPEGGTKTVSYRF